MWLLLDGVDEMPLSDNPLYWINSQIKGWIESARIILTCRVNVWEAGNNYLYNFDVYNNLDFSVVQRNEFIHKWFKNDKLAKEIIDELNKKGREIIRHLINKPLLLTLVCNVWENHQGTLPDTKTGLYEECANAFYRWKEVFFKITIAQRKDLNKALGELAKQALEQQSSKYRLTYSQVSKILGESDEGLFKQALELGWLNLIGVAEEDRTDNVYAFFHPTFQEYFAAQAIDDWDYFLPCNHQDKPVENKRYRIFEEAQWQEVILFWIGRKDIDKEKKESFLNALSKFDDGLKYKCYTLNSKFLASIVLSEYKTYTNAEKLIEEIIQISIGIYNRETSKWQTYIEPIKSLARKALRFIDPDNLSKKLSIIKTNYAYLTDDSEYQNGIKFLEYTLKSISPKLNLDFPDNTNYEFSLKDLENSEDFEESEYISEFKKLLGEFDLVTHDQIDNLIDSIINPKYNLILKKIQELPEYSSLFQHESRLRVQYLEKILNKFKDFLETQPEVVFNKIESLLIEKEQKPFIRFKLANLLLEKMPEHDKSIQTLLELIEEKDISPQDWNLFEEYEELGIYYDENGPVGSTVFHAVIYELKIKKFAIGNQEIISKLIALLNLNHEFSDDIFDVLEEIVLADQIKEVVTEIQLLISEQDPISKINLVKALIRLQSTNLILSDYLFEIKNKSNNKDEQCFAAEELWKCNVQDSSIVSSLLEKISTNSQESYYTLNLLFDNFNKSPNIISELLNFIKNSANHRAARQKIIWKLRDTIPDNPDFRTELKRLMYEDTELYLQIYVAKILRNIFSDSSQSIKEPIDFLARILNSISSDSDRLDTAEYIIKFEPENKQAIKALVALFLNSQEFEPRQFEEDELPSVVDSATYSLCRIQDKKGIILLLKELSISVKKDSLNQEVKKRNYLIYKVLFHCAQELSYPEFYKAWNNIDLETLENIPSENTYITQALNQQLIDLPSQLQSTNKTYCLIINAKNLEDDTDIKSIAREICYQIYRTVFPNEHNIPKVEDAVDLKCLIPKILEHLKTCNLALIFQNGEPNITLINFCKKLNDRNDGIYIRWITKQPVENGIPPQENLITILQNWINEIR